MRAQSLLQLSCLSSHYLLWSLPLYPVVIALSLFERHSRWFFGSRRTWRFFDLLGKTNLLSYDGITDEIRQIRKNNFREGLDAQSVLARPVAENNGSVDNFDWYTHFLGQSRCLSLNCLMHTDAGWRYIRISQNITPSIVFFLTPVGSSDFIAKLSWYFEILMHGDSSSVQ